MSNVELPRQATALVGINGVNVWGDIKEYPFNITFTEVASGATDSFDITMHDINRHWINDWIVDKGTSLNAKIILKNWDKPGEDREVDCGEFLVDSLQVKGMPLEVTLKSVAIPVNGTKNTKKWEKISVSAIAQDICDHLGVELIYYAEDIVVKSIQQSQQTDIEFLFRLCNQYGFGMKVYKHQIVIFDRAEQDKGDIVAVYSLPSICESFTLTDNEEGTYTGVKMAYKLEGDDTEHQYTYGTDEKMIVIDSPASSVREAEIKSEAALYNANSSAVKLKFSSMGGLAMYANTNYYFTDLGGYSGKYAIDKATHSITPNGVYKVSYEAHAISLEKDGAHPPSDEVTDVSTDDIAAGKKLTLDNCPLYVSSDATNAVRNITGTYYLYDGKDFLGRYRISVTSDEVGKTPVGDYVMGYIDGKYV